MKQAKELLKDCIDYRSNLIDLKFAGIPIKEDLEVYEETKGEDEVKYVLIDQSNQNNFFHS